MSDRTVTSTSTQEQNTNTPTYVTLADVPLYRQATPPQQALLEQDLARVVKGDGVPLAEYLGDLADWPDGIESYLVHPG